MFICAMMGGLFPLIKIAEQAITPLTLGMLRGLLASVVLLLVVGSVMKRDLTPLISQWRAFATLGVLLGLFFIAIPEAEERIPPSLASLMTCIIPISTFLIATLILRWEKFTFSRLGGGVIALAVAAFTLEQPLALRPDKEVVLVTLVMGVFSTGAAYAVLNYLIIGAGVVFASTMGYFIPMFAIAASYFLVGDSISWLQVVGLGLTLVGAWLVNRKPEPVAA